MKAWKTLGILLYKHRYSDPFPTLEEVRNQYPELGGLEPRVVGEVYEEVKSRVETASAFVKNHQESIGAGETDAIGALKESGSSVAGLDHGLTLRFFAEADEQKRSSSPLESILRQRLQDLAPTVSPPVNQADHQDSEEIMQHTIEELAAQAAALRSEIRRLDEKLRAFRYPPNLWWGLAILGYLTVGGVIVPLAVLPAGMHHEALKRAVLALFSSGVLALFLYIGAQILALQRGSRGS
jgi:hypothetical protein